MQVADLKQAIEDARRFIAEAERVLEVDADSKKPGGYYHKAEWCADAIAVRTKTTTGLLKAQSLVLSQSLVRIRK